MVVHCYIDGDPHRQPLMIMSRHNSLARPFGGRAEPPKGETINPHPVGADSLHAKRSQGVDNNVARVFYVK